MESSKNIWVVIVGDFNFPHVDCHNAKGLVGLEFVKYVQANFLQQYIKGPTTESCKDIQACKQAFWPNLAILTKLSFGTSSICLHLAHSALKPSYP